MAVTRIYLLRGMGVLDLPYENLRRDCHLQLYLHLETEEAGGGGEGGRDVISPPFPMRASSEPRLISLTCPFFCGRVSFKRDHQSNASINRSIRVSLFTSCTSDMKKNYGRRIEI